MQTIQKCQNYDIWRRIDDAVAEISQHLPPNLCVLGIFVIYAKVRKNEWYFRNFPLIIITG
jgi:hypothetical protein